MQFYTDTVREHRKRATIAASPYKRHGVPAAGRIVKILVGQGHGFIRLTNDREVYFHRADLEEGTSINDLTIGDTVAFEHIDDTVSGPRATHVRRTPALVASYRRDDSGRPTPNNSREDRDMLQGFDRDQPSEVAGQPIHQGDKRAADRQGLEYKRRHETAGIPPESS